MEPFTEKATPSSTSKIGMRVLAGLEIEVKDADAVTTAYAGELFAALDPLGISVSPFEREFWEESVGALWSGRKVVGIELSSGPLALPTHK